MGLAQKCEEIYKPMGLVKGTMPFSTAKNIRTPGSSVRLWRQSCRRWSGKINTFLSEAAEFAGLNSRPIDSLMYQQLWQIFWINSHLFPSGSTRHYAIATAKFYIFSFNLIRSRLRILRVEKTRTGINQVFVEMFQSPRHRRQALKVPFS